jgi:hypothetical protein
MADTGLGAEALGRANALMVEGRPFDAIEVLRTANRENPEPALDRRLAQVRHAAFAGLEPRSAFDRWPPPVADLVTDSAPCIPEITPAELDADVVRRNILAHGSVRVRSLLDEEQVSAFVEGIETTLALRSSGGAEDPSQSWVATLPLPRDEARSLGRMFVAGDGGILAADAPRLLSTLFETYEQIGLREVVAGYLGERPVLSANKCTLRRARLDGGTDWHQDGAFLGQPGIRVVNVWVALTDCGVDAPGMDLVPKRMDRILETGTGGANFDWAVGPDVVAEVAADAPVVRPEFEAGDAVLFDEMFLHRTALDPTMTRTRHAIESWFFAPTDYPEGQVPLVW